MTIGAYRDFIRLKPLDPKNDPKFTLDVSHIIAYKVYSVDNHMEYTCVITSSGHEFFSNETVLEFEERLTDLENNIFIQKLEDK